MDYLTKDQVDVLKQEIDILISNKYQSTKTELVRDSTLRELESRRAGEHEDALENWKLEIENLRVLRLTLAYEPSRINIVTYADWIKKTVGADVILDVTVDPKLVAGAQIIWNGKYQDYSLTKTVYAELQRLLN